MVGISKLTMETLQVMDTKKGHKDLKYDPNDKKEVRKILKFIRQKEKEGFYLYGWTKSGEYVTIQNIKDASNDEIKEFILTREMKKRIITIPETGG